MTLDTPRQFHTASSLPDGSIILAGGSASGFLLPDADLIVTPQ
jgi:hypothetical protein